MSVDFEVVPLVVSRQHRRAPKAARRRCAENTCWQHWLYPVLDSASQQDAQYALAVFLGLASALATAVAVVYFVQCPQMP